MKFKFKVLNIIGLMLNLLPNIIYAQQEVTFDFDKNATDLFGISGRCSGTGATYVPDGEFIEDGVATLDGVTLTVSASPEDIANRNRLWNTSPVLRIYSGTLKVAAPGHMITSIVFKTNDKWGITEVSTGWFEDKCWYADKAIDEVTFTATKNTQIKSIVVTLDGDGDEHQPVEIVGTGAGTKASPYDVERVISLIENGQQTSDSVYVAGTVARVSEVSAEYGNCTYYIAQGNKEIMVYRGLGLGGAAFASEDELTVGDELVIVGVLKDYNGTPEITGSSIITINGHGGPAESEYTPVGNGSKDYPYTVTDIQKMNIEISDGKSYWVKGYILGSAASATILNETDKAVDTNLALGESIDATTFIPVAIPAGNLRDELGVASNPTNVGKEVLVYGTLEQYFSTASVKNVTEYFFVRVNSKESVKDVKIEVKDNTVTLTSATTGATIYYSVDGTNPTTASTKYTAPFTVSHNCTIKAFAVKENMDNSAVTTYVVNTFTAATPTFTIDGDILTISCSTLGASIYYTTNGETPTDKSTEYTAPLTLNDNRTIKAIAYLKDYNTSQVANYTPTNYTCSTVSIDVDGAVLTLSTTTQSATIYYTLDGTMPTKGSTVYSGPVTLATNCTIKAFAVKEYMNDSPISQLTVSALKASKPAFALDGDLLTIKSSTPGASIYYTIGGGDPNESSTLYTAPVKLSDNREVRAIAFADGLNPSDIVSYWPNAFSVASPRFSLDGNMLSIICDTPNSRIHYTIGGQNPTANSERYTTPILLTDNSEIRAIAYADKLNESVVASYIPQSLPCCDVQISYDGHYVTMQTLTTTGTIYYTTNGTVPTISSQKYTSTFEAGGAYLIKAVVKHEGMIDSPVAEFQVQAYFDGEILYSPKPGYTENVFDWCDMQDITSMEVNGCLAHTDLSNISALPSLKHLDMNSVVVEDNHLPDNAFANTNLVSVNLPSSIQTAGSALFDGCPYISAIIWNSTKQLTEAALTGIDNDNLLLYVKMKSLAPSGVMNVIVNNIAESVIITDCAPSFYCPQEFLAKNISYTHEYSMTTSIGSCAGWETIALPFNVQHYIHETAGEIETFATAVSGVKPFWLCGLTENGFESSPCIMPNTPYLISMPNNEAYGEEYILAGKVTFSAENTYVPVTNIGKCTKGDISFVPTMCRMDCDEDVFSLNINEEYGGQAPGSIFVSGLRSLSPFEGYLTFERGSVNMPAMKIPDLAGQSFLPELVAMDGFNVYVQGNTLLIETETPRTIHIFTVEGKLAKVIEAGTGTTKVADLAKGIYLISHTKIMIL